MANLNITSTQQFQFANMDDLLAYQRGEISYAECERNYWDSVAAAGEQPATAICTQVDHERGIVTFDTIQ